MRVAILNRPPGDPRGGDRIAIDYLMESLRKLGIDAQLIHGDDLIKQLAYFDLAHLFHLDFEFCYPNIHALRQTGKPYVVTPIFYPEFRAWVPHETKAVMLHSARAVLPFSVREGEELRERYGDLKYTAIPNGTDPSFHSEQGTDRVGVCSADSWDVKGGNVIAEACALAGVPFVNFRRVPHEEMPGEYRKCKVFVSATKSDRMSLVIGEALCSGCLVLASTANRGNEWYAGLQVVDPEAPVTELARRIKTAYDALMWDWTPNEAARRLTWDSTAEAVVKAYAEAVA